MCVGYSTIMYGTSELSTAIREIAACRYDGIELNLGELRANGPKAVAREVESSDLDVYCVIGEWLESDEQVGRVAEGAELAADLEASFLGLLPPRRGHVDDDTFEEWLFQVADAADGADVTPVLHHHGATHVEGPDEIETWLRRGPDSLSLLLDTAHYYPYGNVVSGIERFADDLAYVHFKDIDPQDEFETYVDGLSAAEFNLDNVINYFRSFTDLGNGVLDFEAVVDSLTSVDYDGPVTIEVENRTEDPLVHAKKNHDYFATLVRNSVTDDRP